MVAGAPHRLARSVAILALSFLTACAAVPPHRSVPEASLSDAVVEGFPANIRFWADEVPADAEARNAARLKQYTEANQAYYDQHHVYPTLQYLAISGGAYDGAFAAGVVNGWSDMGKRPEFAIVTGVSTGALIAPFVFVGQDTNTQIKAFFTTTKSDNIFLSGPLDVLDSLAGGLSFTDNSPLKQKIETAITQELLTKIATEHRKGKRLYIGTTNIEAQRGVIWDIGRIADSGNPNALHLVRQVMLASASIPGAFKPVFMNVRVGGEEYNEIHVDGGVNSQVFLFPLKVQKAVVDEYAKYNLKQELYIIRNSKVTPEYQKMEPGLLAFTQRSVETLIKNQGIGDLYRMYVGAKRDGMDYNLIYIPADFKAESKELFDPEYMGKLFEVGYGVGKTPNPWLKAPPGVEYIK